MNGETTDKNRARIDSEFREGKIDIVIGSPEVMSVGFNWQHVDTVIFVSLDYKDSNFKQAMQRADRGTRSYPLKVIRLYYDCAVEHRLWQIIKRKQEDVRKVGW
jgi:SNF2 family DNA or RNA helicase